MKKIKKDITENPKRKCLIFLPKNAKLNFEHKNLESPDVEYESRKSSKEIEDERIRRYLGRNK